MATNLTEFYGDIYPEVPGCPNPRIKSALIATIREFCSFAKVWKERLTPITTIAIEDKSDIAFVDGSPCTITSTSTSFTDAGFSSGDEVATDHFSDDQDYNDNTGPYTLATAAANTLTLASTDSLSDADAGNEVTIAKCAYLLSSSSGDIAHIDEVLFEKKPIHPRSEAWLAMKYENWRTKMSSAPDFYTVDIQSKLIRLVPVVNEAITDALEVWVVLKPSTDATTIEDFLFDEYQQMLAFGALARLQKMKGTDWYDPNQATLNYNLFLDGRNEAWRHGHIGLTGATSDMEA